MSEVTVESLPEEVIVEVFKWLDTKSLKNVMLTCKEWEDYVRRSHQWTLILGDAFYCAEFESLLESMFMANRKYNKAVLEGGWTDNNDNDNKILEFFEKYGASIHELKIAFHFDSLTDASFWCKILNTMPNLKKVIIETIWEDSINDVSDDELPLLRKLKTLELASELPSALKLFKKCQLHALEFTSTFSEVLNFFHPGHPHQSQGQEGVWNILPTHQDLKELKLDSSRCSALFKTPVAEELITFRLKKLSLTASSSNMPINSINNLMKFMKIHKNTLKELNLSLKLPGSFYEFVFKEFKHLKMLSLTRIAITQESVERLEANESVTFLQLEYYDTTAGGQLAAKSFVTRLPNVQKLMLNSPCDYLFTKSIADNMKQLKDLDINAVAFTTFDGARFPALESLKIRQLDGPVNWFAFARNSPGINELWIGSVRKPIYLDVAGITRNLKLSKLTIKSSQLKCNEKFFEVIRENCSELKSLDLNEKSLKVDISTVADIPGLRFCKF